MPTDTLTDTVLQLKLPCRCWRPYRVGKGNENTESTLVHLYPHSLLSTEYFEQILDIIPFYLYMSINVQVQKANVLDDNDQYNLNAMTTFKWLQLLVKFYYLVFFQFVQIKNLNKVQMQLLGPFSLSFWLCAPHLPCPSHCNVICWAHWPVCSVVSPAWTSVIDS